MIEDWEQDLWGITNKYNRNSYLDCWDKRYKGVARVWLQK